MKIINNSSFKYFPNNKIPIKTKFKIIGAAEAAANLLCEFRIAEKKEAKLTNIKNGNVILVNWIAKSILFESFTKPGAIKLTNVGIKISINKTRKNKLRNNKLKIWFVKVFDFDLFLASSEV